MKNLLRVLTFAAMMAASAWALAAIKTVTLSVPDMNCPVCPLTVKKALTDVKGVSKVEVNFDKKETTVTFDDAETNVNALRKATADAGYPSTLK